MVIRYLKQYINKNLLLNEKNDNKKNVIYFLSLDDYLEKVKMFEVLLKFNETQIKEKEIKIIP